MGFLDALFGGSNMDPSYGGGYVDPEYGAGYAGGFSEPPTDNSIDWAKALSNFAHGLGSIGGALSGGQQTAPAAHRVQFNPTEFKVSNTAVPRPIPGGPSNMEDILNRLRAHFAQQRQPVPHITESQGQSVGGRMQRVPTSSSLKAYRSGYRYGD